MEFWAGIFRLVLLLVIAQIVFHLTIELAVVFLHNFLDGKHPSDFEKKAAGFKVKK